MFGNISPSGKENHVPKKNTSSRKSLGNQRQALNTSGFLKFTDKEDISGLNNKFTDYIDYVRSVEATNEELKNEKQSTIDKFTTEINDIRSVYVDEIDSLRKALDDVTLAKTMLTFENNSLVEEKEKLTVKLKNETNSAIVLRKECCELEENLINYRKKYDSYEQLKKDHAELIQEHTNNQKELKATRCKFADLESRFVTMNDEVEFYKKVNKNSRSSLSSSKVVSVQNASLDRSISQAEEVANIKLELANEFEEYKERLENMYQEDLDNIKKVNEKSSAKCNSLFNEMKSLKWNIEELKSEIFEKDNEIANLNKRVASYTDMLSKVNLDHENYIRDISEDNVHLKRDLESKISELATLINEKITIEKELYMFRSLLEGEQSRCNISEVSSPKKRRHTTCDEDYFDITAWSNERVKLFCDDQYDGSYIVLMNDSEMDVNINEWKIEIAADDRIDVFCFPDRVLKRDTALKCWKADQDLIEDEENVLMNVTLSICDVLNCKITNDMDEIEASFELRKCYGKRKILKAKTRRGEKEGCSIM